MNFAQTKVLCVLIKFLSNVKIKKKSCKPRNKSSWQHSNGRAHKIIPLNGRNNSSFGSSSAAFLMGITAADGPRDYLYTASMRAKYIYTTKVYYFTASGEGGGGGGATHNSPGIYSAVNCNKLAKITLSINQIFIEQWW